jgi:hypothetical protein
MLFNFGMGRSVRWSLACLLASALTGCTAANGIDVASVDDSYLRSEQRLTTRSTIYPAMIYVKPFERDGKLGLCGAYAVDGNTAQRAVLAIQGRQSIVINGINAGRAGFFHINDVAARPPEAGCTVTEIAWQPGFATKPAIQVIDQITRW